MFFYDPFNIFNKTEIVIIGRKGASGYALQNTLSSVKKALELGVDIIEISTINYAYGHLTKEMSNYLHGLGYQVYTHTVNNSIDTKKAVKMGVDGIFTDYPDKLEKFLRSI